MSQKPSLVQSAQSVPGALTPDTEQKTAECERIAGYDPLQIACRLNTQIDADVVERDIHDSRVENNHQLADAEANLRNESDDFQRPSLKTEKDPSMSVSETVGQPAGPALRKGMILFFLPARGLLLK